MLRSRLETLKTPLFAESHDTVWDLKNLAGIRFPDHLSKRVLRKTVQSGDYLGAIVHQVLDGHKKAILDLGSTKGELAFNFRWARAFNPSEYTRKPKKVSDVLKEGDVILVKVGQTTPNYKLSLAQHPRAEGAIIAINPHTRDVVAMVGGYSFARSCFNRATQAKRQPGSAYKPFVYALAIEEELVTPASLITDAPKVYFEPDESGQWKPRNHTRRFMGDITVRTCLKRSVNTCSITLLEATGIKAAHELAKSVDLLTPKTPFPRDLTLALGSADVFPLHFVNAFATFPSLGQHSPPVLVRKIKNQSGEVIFEATPEVTQVLRPETTFVMNQLMQGVMESSSAQIATRHIEHPLAGKTGTSSQMRNAWFVGFSPDLVAGVYVGFDNNDSLGPREYGVRNAMPIWADFMTDALAELEPRPFDEPENIVWKWIDRQTGQLLAEDDIGPNAIYEAFIAGTEPQQLAHGPKSPSLNLFEISGFLP